MKKLLFSFLINIYLILIIAGCKSVESDYLLLKEDDHGFSYVDQKGKIIISSDNYLMCFTDTFKTFAIVWDKEKGLIGIDRNESELYNVFTYDNGPDQIFDGLFRILIDEKIGYANSRGEIVIQPKYDCAWPFKNGVAKVSLKCQLTQEGEHSQWQSDNWFKIDKKGNRVN